MPTKHNTTRPPSHSGRFRKGADPRRHQFTREECQAGFWAALESIALRFPQATNARGHIVLNFLPTITARRAASGKEGAAR